MLVAKVLRGRLMFPAKTEGVGGTSPHTTRDGRTLAPLLEGAAGACRSSGEAPDEARWAPVVDLEAAQVPENCEVMDDLERQP